MQYHTRQVIILVIF